MGGISVAYDPLWAPWRLGYILGDKNKTAGPYDADALLPGADPTCFFCQAVPSGDDRQRVVVQRGEHVIVLLNRYPYNNGHLLVAPKQHVARLDELGPEAELELSQTMTQIVGLLEKKLHPQGFNIGLNLGQAAGAGLPGHCRW